MPDPKRPLKVFPSTGSGHRLCHIMPVGYAHADRDHTRLTKDGVDAWLDKAKPCGERSAALSLSKCRTILPGQDWELEIREAVREIAL